MCDIDSHGRLAGAEVFGLDALLHVQNLGHICSEIQCRSTAHLHSFRTERSGRKSCRRLGGWEGRETKSDLLLTLLRAEFGAKILEHEHTELRRG